MTTSTLGSKGPGTARPEARHLSRGHSDRFLGGLLRSFLPKVFEIAPNVLPNIPPVNGLVVGGGGSTLGVRADDNVRAWAETGSDETCEISLVFVALLSVRFRSQSESGE